MKKSQLAMLFTTAVLVVCGGLLLWKTGFFTAIGSVEEMRDYALFPSLLFLHPMDFGGAGTYPQ